MNIKTGYDMAKDKGWKLKTIVGKVPYLMTRYTELYWTNPLLGYERIAVSYSDSWISAQIAGFRMKREAKKYCPGLPL